MKILSIRIKNQEAKEVRNIEFKSKGISYIYGNIDRPQDENKTINSVGKTLALRFINYILGANTENEKIPKEINGYVIESKVEKEHKIFDVEIKIEDKITERRINGKSYTLNEYKEFFNIERNLFSRQIMLQQRPGELCGHSKNATEDDYVAYLKLLGIDGIIEYVEKIYRLQKEIKQAKTMKKKLIKEYIENEGENNKVVEKDIEKESYWISDTIKTLEEIVSKQRALIEGIQLTKIEEGMMEEYQETKTEHRMLVDKVYDLQYEIERLQRHIDESNKNDIDAENIARIFRLVKVEISEMILKRMEDVEEFNNSVYKERKAYFTNQINKKNEQVEYLEKHIEELEIKCSEYEKIFSDNNVYTKATKIIFDKQEKLKELNYRKGKLFSIKKRLDELSQYGEELNEAFSNCKEGKKQYEEKIGEYREFLNKMTKELYEDMRIIAYLEFGIDDKRKMQKPVTIDISLTKDAGEGINEVKKNMIDMLVFKYNKELGFLIHDSACYNGIDPRQVVGLLKQIDKTAKENDKQAIISINKYQIDNSEFEKNILSNSAVVLNENETLLNFHF